MAKQQKPAAKRKQQKFDVLSLEKMNYYIILAGIAVIVIGYIALSVKPWDSFLALTVAPILLVLGYCVIVPFGIIYRKKSAPAGQTQNETAAVQ